MQRYRPTFLIGYVMRGDEIFMTKVTSKLLPLAQRSTAGLFLNYGQEMLKLTSNQINNAVCKYKIIN